MMLGKSSKETLSAKPCYYWIRLQHLVTAGFGYCITWQNFVTASTRQDSGPCLTLAIRDVGTP